jgi:4-alpha-glucanotransferase
MSDGMNLPPFQPDLQFAFDGTADNPYLPHNYVSNTVVYTGTHDNPTTREWHQELPPYQRQNFWRYQNLDERESGEAPWHSMQLAWSSRAALAIAPLQDLLNLGSEARMNIPGRASGNWTWRCSEEMLSTPGFHSLLELTKSSNRIELRDSQAKEINEAA